MTNKELLKKLKEDMEMRGFSKYTKYSYYHRAKEIIEYFGKSMELVEVKELRSYLMRYLKDEKKLTETSINYYNNTIRFIYDVVIDKLLNKRQLPLYRVKRQLPKILSYDELEKFFNTCSDYRYKTIFMMIYGSGLRISEATKIRIKDIDSENMRIFVQNGKGKKERYTVLPEATLEMLRMCYQKYKPNHPDGYLFLNRKGEPITPESLRVHFRRYRRKAGISEEFIVHSLRHSFATKLVEEGVPLVQIKELLGHNCIRSTMTYVHVANNMQKVKSPLDIYVEKEKLK